MKVGDLRIGDECHLDEQRKEYAGRGQRYVHSAAGMLFRVINTPFRSTNQQLFWDSVTQACVVVPVQYFDGARGSRLYDPETELIVRRDLGHHENPEV